MANYQNHTPPRWDLAPAYDLPNKPPVVLFYDGLLGLCYNSDGEAEIGYLCTAASHQPRLMVIAVKSGIAEMLNNEDWPRMKPPFKEIKFEVTEPSGKLGFFMPTENKYHAQDFRWLIDIEHLHGDLSLDKEDDCFLPRLFFKQGVFYTLTQTKQTYTAVPEGSGKSESLGIVSHWTAAGLDCDPIKGELVLTFDERYSKRWPVRDQRLFVIVQNHCEPSDSKWCQGNPGDTDFDLYYEALEPDSYKVKHKVIADSRLSPPDLDSIEDQDLLLALELAGYVRSVIRDGKKKFEIVSTNEAPCGRTGFGYSDSLEG